MSLLLYEKGNVHKQMRISKEEFTTPKLLLFFFFLMSHLQETRTPGGFNQSCWDTGSSHSFFFFFFKNCHPAKPVSQDNRQKAGKGLVRFNKGLWEFHLDLDSGSHPLSFLFPQQWNDKSFNTTQESQSRGWAFLKQKFPTFGRMCYLGKVWPVITLFFYPFWGV